MKGNAQTRAISTAHASLSSPRSCARYTARDTPMADAGLRARGEAHARSTANRPRAATHPTCSSRAAVSAYTGTPMAMKARRGSAAAHTHTAAVGEVSSVSTARQTTVTHSARLGGRAP